MSGQKSKRLAVRDEPGIGAFVVELRLDPAQGSRMRALSKAEIERLRAGRMIVADRVRAVLESRTAMAPPVHESGDAPGR